MPEKGILLFEAARQSPGWEWRHSSERYSQTDGRKTNEYEKIQETTKNQEELKAKVEKNKKDMEWLRQFIDEMATLLEV